MAIQIKRRDFLGGVAIGTGGILLAGCGSDIDPSMEVSIDAPRVFSPPDSAAYYPPTLTGMRGSHKGSFEVAHALAWRGEKPAHYKALNEHYDLVVVGAGMSGLAAAWFYREKMGPDARILVLDNHDDFGGHAKRNEFHRDGRMMLSLGGAQNIESIAGYSDNAARLMAGIGIDTDFFETMYKQTPADAALAGRLDGANGVSLPGRDGHITVGGNWITTMFGGEGYKDTVRALPIPKHEQETLIAFFGGTRDFLQDLSLSETW